MLLEDEVEIHDKLEDKYTKQIIDKEDQHKEDPNIK